MSQNKTNKKCLFFKENKNNQKLFQKQRPIYLACKKITNNVVKNKLGWVEYKKIQTYKTQRLITKRFSKRIL